MIKLTERVYSVADRPEAALHLDWDGRRRTRFQGVLSDGRPVSVELARPPIGSSSCLRQGDVLRGVNADGEVVCVEVVAAAEPLLEVRCETAVALARCAYHLGNRHASVQVLGHSGHSDGTSAQSVLGHSGHSDGTSAQSEGTFFRLRTGADPVMKPMLEGLGAEVFFVEARFDPEAGAYTHHHEHEGRHDSGPARIHRFGSRGP